MNRSRRIATHGNLRGHGSCISGLLFGTWRNREAQCMPPMNPDPEQIFVQLVVMDAVPRLGVEAWKRFP